MKKLMIGLTAIAMAVGAEAAALDWKTTAVYDGNAEDKIADGSVGYLIVLATDDQRANIYSSLSGVGADAANSWIAENKAAGFDKTASGGKFAYLDSEPAYAKGDYYAYAVIFDASSISDAANVYVTDALAVSVPDSGAGYASFTSSMLSDAKTAGAWHQVGAVPEPTSGLLLLLGVAGLALRRRRA